MDASRLLLPDLSEFLLPINPILPPIEFVRSFWLPTRALLLRTIAAVLSKKCKENDMFSARV